MFKFTKLEESKSIELDHDQLDMVSGGAMSDAEYMQFLVTVSNWAKEQASKPVRFPGL